MKIVYLDAHPICPKDVNLDRFNELGEFRYYDRVIDSKDTHQKIDGAQILLINKVPITEELLTKNPQIRYVGVTATGVNTIDLQTAKAQGVTITNVPDYSTEAVAQQTFAMILAFTNRLSEHADPQKWVSQPDFSYHNFPILELAHKTLGLYGYGNIGKRVSSIAEAFNMKVIIHKRSLLTDDTYRQVDFETLIAESDFLSLHAPLTSENKNIFNKEVFNKMKPASYFINTARGGLVNEQDLAEALKKGQLAGAYLDVLQVEPPPSDHPLFNAPNLKISPHLAWASYEARIRLVEQAFLNLKAFLNQKKRNVING